MKPFHFYERIFYLFIVLIECYEENQSVQFITNFDLHNLKVDKKSISVSGLSSGGYMAVQFHVAFSASVMGAGIIAAGPYWCAQANLAIAQTACMTDPQAISVPKLVDATEYAATMRSIDQPSNMKNSRVWLFAGANDSVVVPGVVKKLEDYYQVYIPRHNIQTSFSVECEHAMITANYGNPCMYLGTPYINKCPNVDVAGDLLHWIYGSLKSPTVAKEDNFRAIDQRQYTPFGIRPQAISLADTGYVYIPTSCWNGTASCRLHVVFHGCLQYQELIGMQFVKYTGYNEWAESNQIIVLYPQTTRSDLIPYNPKGCWDWWGYTGLDYATKIAPQLATVRNIISSTTE
jgi:hypothetical protein